MSLSFVKFLKRIFTKCFECVTVKPQTGGSTQDGDSKSFRRTARRAAQAAAWAMEKERFSTSGDGERSGGEHAPRPLLCCAAGRATAVQPCGEFSSTGGRKPRAWSACPGARYVVGADITLRHVSLVAVDLSGQVTRTQTATLAFTRTPAYFRALAAFISELCAERPAIGFGRRPVHSRHHRQRAGPRPALPRAFHSGTAGR